MRGRHLKAQLFEVTVLLCVVLLRAWGRQWGAGGVAMLAWEESPCASPTSLQLSQGHREKQSCRSGGQNWVTPECL